MAKMVEVTEAGGAFLGNDEDQKIHVNADSIIQIVDTNEDEVGNSRITFNDGTQVYVTESKSDLADIINK